MLQAFFNIFKVAELRNRLLFTLGALVIYRVGFWIPLPAINQSQLLDFAKKQSGSFGDISQFVSIFTGGSLSQSTLFGLGILPYISASIILQLLATVWEPLKNLQKEGPGGRQKIQEYTRYITFALAIIQSIFYLSYFQKQDQYQLVFPVFKYTVTYWACGIMAMTTGTMFLMWLAEQIDKYGIGNGASMIITAGILARKHTAIQWLSDNFSMNVGGGDPNHPMTPDKIVLLILAYIFVVMGTVLITQGQRRIPVQQAKHTRGRRVYGGQKSYLPLRVNHGGVMPIIFASSLLMFPTMGFDYLNKVWPNSFFQFFAAEFSMSSKYSFLYLFCYIMMIYFFAFFWTSVQFQPKEMADQLRDHGSFIPGLRPGPRTADYLEKVMERITYVGAGFLAFIAVVPTVISGSMGVPPMVSSFLGGTGLLITVSVALDLIQRIEANLLMRNYRGFLGGEGPGGKGPRIRGART